MELRSRCFVRTRERNREIGRIELGMYKEGDVDAVVGYTRAG